MRSCRICTKTDVIGSFVPCFSNNGQFVTEIFNVFNIKLTDLRDSPAIVCRNCERRVRNANELRKTILESEIHFKATLMNQRYVWHEHLLELKAGMCCPSMGSAPEFISNSSVHLEKPDYAKGSTAVSEGSHHKDELGAIRKRNSLDSKTSDQPEVELTRKKKKAASKILTPTVKKARTSISIPKKSATQIEKDVFRGFFIKKNDSSQKTVFEQTEAALPPVEPKQTDQVLNETDVEANTPLTDLLTTSTDEIRNIQEESLILDEEIMAEADVCLAETLKAFDFSEGKIAVPSKTKAQAKSNPKGTVQKAVVISQKETKSISSSSEEDFGFLDLITTEQMEEMTREITKLLTIKTVAIPQKPVTPKFKIYSKNRNPSSSAESCKMSPASSSAKKSVEATGNKPTLAVTRNQKEHVVEKRSARIMKRRQTML